MIETIEDIKVAIKKLESRQVAELRDWLEEFYEALWDRQFEEDVAAGRLDKLGAEALEEDRAGKTREL